MSIKNTLDELIDEKYRLTIKQSQINYKIKIIENAIEFLQREEDGQHKMFEDEQ